MIVRKLAELGNRPKGCQNNENHWPEASDAIFVNFKELHCISQHRSKASLLHIRGHTDPFHNFYPIIFYGTIAGDCLAQA
jgi:hypothetical protein